MHPAVEIAFDRCVVEPPHRVRRQQARHCSRINASAQLTLPRYATGSDRRPTATIMIRTSAEALTATSLGTTSRTQAATTGIPSGIGMTMTMIKETDRRSLPWEPKPS
jgi:hypothetical protein